VPVGLGGDRSRATDRYRATDRLSRGKPYDNRLPAWCHRLGPEAVAVLVPARQLAGHFVDRNPVPAVSYTTLIIILCVVQALLGAWIYLKYRTYVTIPMEELHFWMTFGSFEFKAHVIAMGLLPAYWFLWQEPQSTARATVRKWVTVFLAFSAWYGFVIGHLANDFRGIGS